MYTETGSGPEYAAAIGHIRLEKLKSRTRSLWNYFSDEASPYQVTRIKLSFAYDIFGVSLKQQMAPFVLCPGSIKGVVPTSYSEDGRLLAFADDTWVYLYDTKEDLFSGVRLDLKALPAELQMGRSEPRKDWFCICRLREKERAAPHTGLIGTRNHEAHPDTGLLNDSDYYICQQIESQMKSYDLSASDDERRYFSVSLNRYVRE
ncbi:hypothetical protein EYR41_007435 [Orbilia oligospora]|uniref:Uncharacterized protein n=1 Tax=Orbilia oligospora TaxID=2813651 RepID=A0A7C8JW38_ORBOL|nr:hypothetical protein TWF751_002895 [Orbilia oligospora]TGJ68379.1 hypothetical protein EYR41_007435 [Orbilia oligospora]